MHQARWQQFGRRDSQTLWRPCQREPKRAEKTTDLILDLDPRPHENLAGCQKRSQFVADARLDPDLLKPTRSNDLGEACSVISVGLVGAKLQRSICVTSINANDWQTSVMQLVPKPNR